MAGFIGCVGVTGIKVGFVKVFVHVDDFGLTVDCLLGRGCRCVQSCCFANSTHVPRQSEKGSLDVSASLVQPMFIRTQSSESRDVQRADTPAC